MKNVCGKKIVLWAVLALLLVPVTVKAEEEHAIDRRLGACIDKDYSTAGMLNCLDEAYIMWDKELNAVYQGLRGLLNPRQKDALKTSQRAWLAYRDAEFETIELIYGSLDGTMWSLAARDDKVGLLRSRVLELSVYLESLREAK